MATSESTVSRRRFLGAAAAAGLAGPTLAACARAPKPAGGSGGGGTLTIYWNAGHVYDAYKDVITKFEKDHDVTVNWQKFQWDDLTTKLQADLASGNVPDLVEYPGGDNLMSLAKTGDVLSLEKYIAKDGKKMGYPDDWNSQAVKTWKYQNEIYGVQLQLTCNQFYYNKGMLDDAGISKFPETWEELLDAAKELTGKGKYGLALNQDYTYSYPWLLQNGVSSYDPSSKTVLAPNDAAIEATQFQKDLVHKYKVSPVPTPSSDYSRPQKLLSAKRVAMILTGPWDIGPIRQGSPDLDLGLALPLKHKVRSTHFAGSGVMIPKKAKNADLAWDLIKRMTTLEVELKVTKETGQSMPRKTWAQQDAVKSDPIMHTIAEALEYAVDWWQPLAKTGKTPQVGEAYKTFYQSVVLKGTDPAKAMPTFLQASKQALG